MNDQQAILRMKAGDITGLEAIVRRYQVKAVRTAILITRDRALAEDVVQAAFLNAFHHIDQFDIQRPFAPWFLRSVANAALRAAQQQGRDVSLDVEISEQTTLADLLPDVTHLPDNEAEAAELRHTVQTALDQLAPEQRLAVVLHYYLDLSTDEIATELATPPATVRWRLHAARKQLRWLLRQWGRG